MERYRREAKKAELAPNNESIIEGVKSFFSKIAKQVKKNKERIMFAGLIGTSNIMTGCGAYQESPGQTNNINFIKDHVDEVEDIEAQEVEDIETLKEKFTEAGFDLGEIDKYEEYISGLDLPENEKDEWVKVFKTFFEKSEELGVEWHHMDDIHFSIIDEAGARDIYREMFSDSKKSEDDWVWFSGKSIFYSHSDQVDDSRIILLKSDVNKDKLSILTHEMVHASFGCVNEASTQIMEAAIALKNAEVDKDFDYATLTNFLEAWDNAGYAATDTSIYRDNLLGSIYLNMNDKPNAESFDLVELAMSVTSMTNEQLTIEGLTDEEYYDTYYSVALNSVIRFADKHSSSENNKTFLIPALDESDMQGEYENNYRGISDEVREALLEEYVLLGVNPTTQLNSKSVWKTVSNDGKYVRISIAGPVDWGYITWELPASVYQYNN